MFTSEMSLSASTTTTTGYLRALPLGGGGPFHMVNLTPALDPWSSGGWGQAPPLPSLKGSPGGVSASLVPWRAVVPSPVGKVYSGGPLLGYFRSGVCQGGVILFIFSIAFPLGAAFSSPSQEAHTPSLMQRFQLRSQGVHGGGPFRSLLFPNSSRRLFIALLDFPFVAWRRPRRPPCLLLRGLGDVLSF
jgi:hypothetical protein